jgi:hypothetical protein
MNLTDAQIRYRSVRPDSFFYFSYPWLCSEKRMNQCRNRTINSLGLQYYIKKI